MEPTITEPQKANVHLLGTSHIAKQSVHEIEQTYMAFSPDIVCVELDRGRLTSLLEEQYMKKKQTLPLTLIGRIGLTGYLFVLIGRTLQKKLGNIVDVQPGVDMMCAVTIAREHNKPLFCIDQDIIITMRHLSSQFTFKEKMRLLFDLLSAPFLKQKINISLHKVPKKEIIITLLKILRDRYPSLYNVLIVERNIVMARILDSIIRKNPGKKILVVIGAGHEDDLRERLRNMERIATIV